MRYEKEDSWGTKVFVAWLASYSTLFIKTPPTEALPPAQLSQEDQDFVDGKPEVNTKGNITS